MEINRKNISQIMADTDIIPDKDYGQNFLVDPEVAKRIADSLKIVDGDTVIEVGTGLGSLTHFLSLSNNKITSVEIDERVAYFVAKYYTDSNVKIINNDIRNVDVSNHNKIIGNLPYNITTELIQYLLINGKNANRMVFMIQSEAFPHFFDVSGKEYGPTSVLIHLLGSITRLFAVRPGSFYPMPKCNSVVFAIDINETNNRDNIIDAFKVAKQLFLNRRKTILNNLNAYLKDKEIALKVCEDLSINSNARPEQLDPITYLKISDYLKAHKTK